MKKLSCIMFALTLALVACSSAPSASMVETAIIETQAAWTISSALPPTSTLPPSPIATLVPLSEIDLRLALISGNELPEGLSATKTKDTLPNLDVPDPTKLIWQQIERGMDVAGGLRIYLYESKIDVENAYQAEKNSMADLGSVYSIPDIGEKAAVMTYRLDEREITDIVFIRCYTTVTIRLDNKDAIHEYAKALDAKLITLVCR